MDGEDGRVTHTELWTVEASSREEAEEKAMACDTIDELEVDLCDWGLAGDTKEEK